MKKKRIGRDTIRKRLKEQAPEVIARRETNFNVQRKRQRRTFAANAQAVHDRYVGDLQAGPRMDGVSMLGVGQHKFRLRKLLTEMNAYQDPRMGLPPY